MQLNNVKYLGVIEILRRICLQNRREDDLIKISRAIRYLKFKTEQGDFFTGESRDWRPLRQETEKIEFRLMKLANKRGRKDMRKGISCRN